ncbi:hypothetical protein BKA69DRAFT_1086415 [Paraphysoderma sedebokerense]|nr:hypothetical protein BKA69DRAFT_1086415 [Paraphysoderma sedebokerense]
MDPTIICVWTSQNTVDEYSFASFTYLRTRTINSTPMKFNPSISKNTTDKTSYFFHRSVNLAGNPFVLHKRNETYQQMSSAVLPYQISFSDSIPEYGIRVGSNSSAFVGFTTTLNTSVAYGDFETVVSQHHAADLGLQGQMIISTVGKENFAAIIPQANNGFIVVGRTNGNLNSPSSATGSTVVFATQFGPLKVNSFISAKPMQISPSEVVQVQFEFVPSSLTATIPTVTFNGLACSSVSWTSSNTLSVQMPSDVAGAGLYLCSTPLDD